MKPETLPTSVGADKLPKEGFVEPARGGERYDMSATNESGLESAAEEYERNAEASAIASDMGLSSALPTPVAYAGDASDDGTNTGGGLPITANDDDLIEKEWVDKAKKIITETKSDPYKQEERVSKLQVDYIKKRYGRDLGAAD